MANRCGVTLPFNKLIKLIRAGLLDSFTVLCFNPNFEVFLTVFWILF